MLRIYILNVGHGDSIVLEHIDVNAKSSFAVIDSNCSPGESPKALELLKKKGAETISFAAITHPHADHYMGMKAILEAYQGKIDTFYTFPLRHDRPSIRKLVTAYKNAAEATDDEAEKSRMVELGHILRLAVNNVAKVWESPSGNKNQIFIPGFLGVSIFTILPPAKVRGGFFQDIDNGRVEPEKESLNSLSMAFLIEYGDQQVILGGDGEKSNWIYQNKIWTKGNIQLSPVAVKLPHHGSKRDCDEAVQQILFGPQERQPKDVIACISANGRSHPAEAVLEKIVQRGVKPYCTNLSTRCGANLKKIITSHNIDPVLLRFINSASLDSDSSIQTCQGDITIELAPGIPMSVTTQYKHICAMRGDLSFLSSSVLQ